ncbi:acyl-CoA dehydrogenase family protein [Streptomyces sp. NPDC058653]|uniref:acyl-CoA dehydrogenase family protein n=1 Tax=Streptomyces sp. NPDC058653 TaxID=3346576 RepID=UPI00364FF050
MTEHITTTSPVPAAVLSGAATVAEVAADRAKAGEEDRRLAPEVVAALVEAGFARHFVPAVHGGSEGGFTELTEAVARVGEGCASAAWAASLAAYAGRYAAYLPPAAQEEIWGGGPDVLLAGALVPSGKVERSSRGWRLTGAWPYISGVHHADWVLACAAVRGDDTGEDDEVRFFAVPRAEHRVERTWSTSGMRATGSDTLVLDGAVVPEHRSFPRATVLAGRAPRSLARCHTVRMAEVGALPFVAPLIGAVRGALRAWTARTSLRVDARGRAVAASPLVRSTLARAAGEVDAAELLVLRAAAVADGDARVSGVDAAVRGPRDTALAVELLVAAVGRIMRASGTSGQTESDPVQRFWRDVNAAASHVALSFDTAGPAYGAWALEEAR